MSIEEFQQFLQSGGRIDADTLSAECPQIAKEIREGRLSEPELMGHFSVYKLFFLPLKNEPQRMVDWTKVLIHFMTGLVFDTETFQDLMSDTELKKTRDDFWSELETFDEPSFTEMKEVGSFKAIVCSIQQHFDQTAEQWQDRYQKLPKSLKEGGMYKVPYNQFRTLTLKVLEKAGFDISQIQGDNHVNIEAMKRKLIDVGIAAKGVAEGHDVIQSTCWGCGVTQGDKIHRCSSCHVARYCSRECQTKNWQGGHKKACKELKATYARFNQDLERIESQDAIEGVPSKNPFVEYDILYRIVESDLDGWCDIRLQMFSRGKRPTPSLRIFHSNLAAIACNDSSKWPFFYRGENEARLPGDYNGPNDFINACFYLCFDIPDFVKLPNSLSPEQLLHIYAEYDELSRPLGDRDPNTAKSWCVGRVFKMLKEKYNGKTE